MGLKSFFSELKRRNIYKVAVVYAITGWVLAQIASIAANTFGAPSWVMKMIITVILLGFPISLIITWAFEITPNGVKRTQTDQEIQQVEEGTFWVGIGLVTVLLLGGWWYFTMEPFNSEEFIPQRNITDRSIAVLPLKSVGGDDEPFALAEGLHDDLLTRLANVSDLKVISRTSVEHYRNTKMPLPAIADSLRVKWILEGGVQKGGNKVQINAQLIDPSSDTHIWAKTYQRDLNAGDIFAIQGEIAREIAKALQAELSAGEQERIAGAPTGDLNAYHLYAQGRQELAKRTLGIDEHVKEAVNYFHRAIQEDSSFALAWTGLADAAATGLYAVENPDSVSIFPVDQETAARRALEIDPDLAEAHASMGFAELRNMNAPVAREHLQRAIELKPSYWQAHHLLGELYKHIGHHRQALDHLKLANELNPQHARARHWLYDAYNATGQPEKSLQEARRQQEMGLESIGAIGGEVRALMQLRKYEEAQQLAENHLNTSFGKWFRAYLVQILSAKGDTVQALEYLNQLESAEVLPRILAWAYIGLGKTDKALETYQRLEPKAWRHIGAGGGLRSLGKKYPAVKEDPRHKELMQNFYQAWGLNPDGSFPDKANKQRSEMSSS